MQSTNTTTSAKTKCTQQIAQLNLLDVKEKSLRQNKQI